MNKAAKIASALTLRALSSLQERVKGNRRLTDDELALLLSPEARNMIKEAQDRAHGTPKQSLDHTSGDGSMTPAAPIQVTSAVARSLAKKLTD